MLTEQCQMNGGAVERWHDETTAEHTVTAQFLSSSLEQLELL